MEKVQKRNNRAEILATARRMFGEEGYNSVTMRDIADAVGISVGNLTYHFKKKEDLIEAVFMEQNTRYKHFQTPKTLEEMHEMFMGRIQQQHESAYYFRHYTQLAQCCPKVYKIQLQAKVNNSKAYMEAFHHFLKDGYVREEGMKDQYKSLAYALTMMNIYWLPDTHNSVSAIRCMWSLVYPVLTQKGVAVFKKYIEPDLQ